MTDTAHRQPLPLQATTLANLPQVVGVEVLPAGGATLHLEGGQVVDMPAQQNATFTPEEYAPSVLILPQLGLQFIVPDPLRLPIMWALGFDLADQDVSAALVVDIEPLEGNRARLSLGGGYSLTLPRLARMNLTDIYPDGEALLFAGWRSTTAPAFRIPSRMYAELVAALGLRPAGGPRWVLSDVVLTAETVTFWAAHTAAPVLTLARPCWAQVGHNLDTGVTLLTVAQDEPPAYPDAPPARWCFSVPDTTAGRACLLLLGWQG